MNDDTNIIYELHANFCSTLANEKRLKILHFLAEKEHSVGEIAKKLEIPPSNVSQHLRIMRNLGAVKARKKGTKVYYHISSKKFSEGYRLIREGLAELHFSKSDVLFPEDRKK
jgi:ArsR family transcriptional regulator